MTFLIHFLLMIKIPQIKKAGLFISDGANIQYGSQIFIATVSGNYAQILSQNSTASTSSRETLIPIQFQK